jgi:hypothetical protein
VRRSDEFARPARNAPVRPAAPPMIAELGLLLGAAILDGSMPLPQGIELRLGGGVARYAADGGVNGAALVLGARWAPTPNLQFALPFMVTASRPISAATVMALSGGVSDVGAGFARGSPFVFVRPAGELSLHSRSPAGSVLVGGGLRGGVMATNAVDFSPSLVLRSGWVFAINEKISIGASAELSVLLVDLTGSRRQIVHIVAGSPYAGPNSSIPLMRYQILSDVSVDGWLWADAANLSLGTTPFIGFESVALAVSLTWRG